MLQITWLLSCWAKYCSTTRIPSLSITGWHLWPTGGLIGAGVLPHCRGAVDVFYSPSQQGLLLYRSIKHLCKRISQRNRPAQQPTDGLHPKKIMLGVWWNIWAIVHYELLNNNQTITSNHYCNQHQGLKTALDKKTFKKGVILHHNNACSHTA